MKKLIYLIIILAILLFGSCNTHTQTNMISFEEIKEVYDKMKADGVNTDTNMLYGYFFTNNEPMGLENVATELKEMNFDYVDIYQDEDSTYWLHMERIEKHDAKSLFELNKSLYKIADKHKIDSYDGFDIGNADKTKPIK